MSEIFPFNLNHLRYFYEVARAGNMRRAAGSIGISQPALSKQIQALEETIGLQLFYRSSRGLQPTPDGEAVFAHCERVFGHLRDLEGAIESLREGTAGRVKVAATYSIGVHLLPALIRRFHDSHPQIRYRIITARSKQVLQALREHRVDVGFVAGHPEDDTYEVLPFQVTPLVVVASTAHPFASQAAGPGALSAERLHRTAMVALDAQAPTRELTDRYMAKLGAAPRIVADSPDIETIKRLVRENVGFAVLPAHCVTDEVAGGALAIIDVAGWSLDRSLYLVHLSRPQLLPAVRQFIELVSADAAR